MLGPQQADLIMMESMVLSSLSFRISMPTVCTFLSLYQQAVGMGQKAAALSSYIAVGYRLPLTCHVHGCHRLLSSSLFGQLISHI